MTRIITSLKLIKRSKVLNRKEKIKMIALAFCEGFCNSYKLILKLPFLIFAIPLILIGAGFEYLGEFFQNVGNIVDIPVQKINEMSDITFTKGKAREKLLAEIKGKRVAQIK